jgi:hypothetical protein
VHALMGAVLVGRGRKNPLVLSAQAHPPHIELREAVNPGRGEGHPIVRANRARQPVFAKQPIEDRTHTLALGGEQAVARQEIARVLVGDRQRVAVDPVAGPEVPLEVGRPEIVGPGGGRRDDAVYRRHPERRLITAAQSRQPSHCMMSLSSRCLSVAHENCSRTSVFVMKVPGSIPASVDGEQTRSENTSCPACPATAMATCVKTSNLLESTGEPVDGVQVRTPYILDL